MERSVHRREGIQGREDEKKKEEQRKKTKKKRDKGIGKRKKMREGFGGEHASNEKKKKNTKKKILTQTAKHCQNYPTCRKLLVGSWRPDSTAVMIRSRQDHDL